MTDNTFLAGAAGADITPPLDVGILMSAVEGRWAPFQGVRLPLRARAVVIEAAGRRAALVSMDLLGLSGEAFGGREAFKNRVIAASEQAVSGQDLVLAATHTHSAPESLALTGLYRTPAFEQWAGALAVQIGQALRQAVGALRPCRLAVGRGQAAGLAIYRRIKTTEGIVLSHPPPPLEKVISRAGPVDNSVNVAALVDASDRPVAILVNATCHPVHEMCLPYISPDYPGEMSLRLEERYPGATALFLNGAAGNINPPTVSGGADDAQQHGQRLAEVVSEILGELQPAGEAALSLHRRPLTLPARDRQGRSISTPLATELAALRLGNALFLFIPGELFVEIGLAIRAGSPNPLTFIVGYAEDAIGYLPTDHAFDEGGYELGPGPWARVDRGSEGIIQSEALALLTEAMVGR